MLQSRGSGEYQNGIETSTQGMKKDDALNTSQQVLLQAAESPTQSIGRKPKKGFARMVLFFHLNQFMRKLQRYFRPDNFFTREHFRIIDDHGSGEVEVFLKNKSKARSIKQTVELDRLLQLRIKLQQWKKRFEQYKNELIDQVPLIEPNNKIKIAWDMLLCVARLYLLFLIPIMITFEDEVWTSQNELIIFIFSGILMFDMGLRFFTIYFEQGLPVRDALQIRQNQSSITNLFEFSGLAIAMFICAVNPAFVEQFVLGRGWLKVLLMLYFAQIKNILLLINSWQQSSTLGRLTNSIIDLVKLVGLILLIQHLAACIWILIGRQSVIMNVINWVQNDQQTLVIWSDFYIDSLYFTTVTMFTVGYGDIHPFNSGEKIFAIIYMFLCTFQLSHSVNTIGNILKEIKEDTEIIDAKLTYVNQFMKHKKISPTLQLRVREYLNFYWRQEQQQQSKQESDILNSLTPDLKRQLALEANTIILQYNDFFSKHFSEAFVSELTKNLAFRTFQPQQEINLYEDNFYNLYIIEYGEVIVYESRNDNGIVKLKEIKTLKRGQSIGFESFITAQKSRLVYKTTGFASVLCVNGLLFQTILQKYPNDLETFQVIKLKSELSKCHSCNSVRHQTDDCRQIHYIPDREGIIKRYLFQQSNDRRSFVRNVFRNRNCYRPKKDQDLYTEAANVVKIGYESQYFKKYQDQDTIDEDVGEDKLFKLPQDSIGLLVKDIDENLVFTQTPNRSRANSKQQLISQSTMSLEMKSELNTMLQIRNNLRYKHKYSKVEIDQMDHTLKYLELMHIFEELQGFECAKEFDNFFCAFNLSKIIQVRQRKSLRSLDCSYSMSLGNFKKYLLYPYEFILNYRIKPDEEDNNQNVTLIKRHQFRISSILYKKKVQGLKQMRGSLQVYPVKSTSN